MLLRDRDTKFVAGFDEVLRDEGVEVVRITYRSPNLNARAERLVQTVRRECLDQFLVVGEDHLRALLASFLTHYHEECPHQALGNAPLTGVGPPADATLGPGDVACETRLGGMLRHYCRRAA